MNKQTLAHVRKQFIPSRSIEYNDNRISRFIAQYGKCAITGIELGMITPYAGKLACTM